MEILRKRTFFEETASANVEANSGDTVIPDVADMVERTPVSIYVPTQA